MYVAPEDDPLRPRLEPWRETAAQRAQTLALWKQRAVTLASITVAYNLVATFFFFLNEMRHENYI